MPSTGSFSPGSRSKVHERQSWVGPQMPMDSASSRPRRRRTIMLRFAHGQPRATTSRYRLGSTGQPYRPSAVMCPFRYVVSRLNSPVSLIPLNLGASPPACERGAARLADLVQELQRAADDQRGGARVVARQRAVGEQVLVTRVGEQLGKLGTDDGHQFAGGLKVALVGEVRVVVHAVDLHRDPVWPQAEGPVFGERDARLVQERAARARCGLREALGGGATEGEAAVDQAGRQAGEGRARAPVKRF